MVSRSLTFKYAQVQGLHRYGILVARVWSLSSPLLRDVYNCSLAWNYSNYSCSFDTLIQNPQDDYISTFTDMDVFQITLYINRDGDISSRLLDDNFKPVEHSRWLWQCTLKSSTTQTYAQENTDTLVLRTETCLLESFLFSFVGQSI